MKNLKNITNFTKKKLVSLFYFFLSKAIYFKKKLSINYEIFKLKIKIPHLLKNKTQELIFVYDLRISSIAYGDFFYATYFLKFLNADRIRFIIINDYTRDNDRYRFDKEKLNYRIEELIELLEYLFVENANTLTCEKISWDNFKKKYNKNKNILFKDLVLNEKPIYLIPHASLHKLFYLIDKKNFYIKSNDKIKIKPLQNEKYISVGLRIDFSNEPQRNFNIIFFNQLIEKIRKKEKIQNIVIVSDYAGTKKLKEKLLLTDDNIFFSKDYNSSFLDDGKLILNSSKYYQVGGSGISVFAEHSRLKYDMFLNFKQFFNGGYFRSNFHYSVSKFRNVYPWTNEDQSIYKLNYINEHLNIEYYE